MEKQFNLRCLSSIGLLGKSLPTDIKEYKQVVKPCLLNAVGKTTKDLFNSGYILRNPNAIDIIEEHWNWLIEENKINWYVLFENPNVGKLIERHWEQFINDDDLIHSNMLDIFCSNPSCISLIERHWNYLLSNNKIAWTSLCCNPNAVHLIERYWDQLFATHEINWRALCGNPNAVHLIERHWDWLVDNNEMCWVSLCCNVGAAQLIERHWDFIRTYKEAHHGFRRLADNENPHVMQLIADNFEQIKFNLSWKSMCSNPAAISLIDKHWDLLKQHNRIYWTYLLNNDNLYKLSDSRLQEIITSDKIDWDDLGNRPGCYPIIEKYWDVPKDIPKYNHNLPIIDQYLMHYISKHSFELLYENPIIFEDEYRAVAIKWFRSCVTEELMACVWHPRNIDHFPSWGIDPNI